MADERSISSQLPAIAISGYSNSGKTTLLERLVPRLAQQGLRTAVLKHDTHGLNLDTPGKDSDRLYQAGADILLQGPEQSFVRIHGTVDIELRHLLLALCQHYDLVLVEGRKWTPCLDKIWLRRDPDDRAPEASQGVQLDLGRDEDRVERVMDYLLPWLSGLSRRTPVYAGILVGEESSHGGASERMVSESHRALFEQAHAAVQGRVERVVVLGDGTLPAEHVLLLRIPDAPGMAGPRAGMLAAMRWAPLVSWVFMACDMPLITGEAVDWVLGTRAQGVWASLPRLTEEGRPEPLPGHYDFRARSLLERRTAPHQLASHAKVTTPVIPAALAGAWRNLSTRAAG